MDAALARTNLALCSREVHWIGYPQGWRTIEPADIGTIVQKTGRSTGILSAELLPLTPLLM